jgi:outer membrane protein TolC
MLGLILLMAVAGPASAQQSREPISQTVTLNEALQLAAEHSPQVVQAQGTVRTAQAAERSIMGSFLPTLSLTSGGSLTGNDQQFPQNDEAIARSSDSYSLGFASGVDLYTGGRRGAESKQARAEAVSAGATLVEREFSVALETKRAFFEVLRAGELLRVAETRVERAVQALAIAEDRQRVGSATRSDVLRSQLELTRARQAVLEGQNQQRNATFSLAHLVGAEGAVGARQEEELSPTPLALSSERIVEAAMREAPSIVAAEAAVRSSEAGIGVARAQYLPSLRLSSGYNFAHQDPALWDGNRNWNIGVNLSLPIFNGFQREESVERARVQSLVASTQLTDAQLAARANAERLLGSLTLAEQTIAIATESVQVAEEDLRVQQDRYRLGASTILDQIASQESLVQAETDLVAARYDYQIARAELESLLGRPL